MPDPEPIDNGQPGSLGAPGGGAGKRRRMATWVAAVALGLGLTLLWHETRPSVRDRRAILARVALLEQEIRAHDRRIWLQAEGAHPVGAVDPAQAAAHEAMFRDFNRLGHLEDLRLTNVEVEIAGDTARVRYRVVGSVPRSERRFAKDAPTGGEFSFSRGRTGWLLTGHRLIERGSTAH